MALRWCAAGMLEAKKQFRRVNGHLHLKALRTALEAHVAARVTPDHYATKRRWPHSRSSRWPSPKFHGGRDILVYLSTVYLSTRRMRPEAAGLPRTGAPGIAWSSRRALTVRAVGTALGLEQRRRPWLSITAGNSTATARGRRFLFLAEDGDR